MGQNAGILSHTLPTNADDAYLLRQYVRHGSQAAFAELVRRYSGLVQATCLREVDDPQFAEDVTQVVFLLFARKAPSLLHANSLAGWLFRAARFSARNALRHERRRKVHEQEVIADMTQAQLNGLSLPSWRRPAPLLNAALAALRPHEQEVVLLRYLEGRSWRETAARLGLAEDAAQKRGTRALDKMRRFLNRQGLMLSVAALTTLLSEEAARAAPLPAAVITQTVGAIADAGCLSPNVAFLYQGVLHTMKMTKIAATFGGFAVVGTAVGILWAQGAPKSDTPLAMSDAPLALLKQVRSHYQGLSSFSMRLQHQGDNEMYPGAYTQQLQWRRGGRFEMRNTSPENKALSEKLSSGNGQRTVPDFVADGTQVVSVLPSGKRRTEPEASGSNSEMGWEVTGGEIVGWLQDTPTSDYFFHPQPGMTLTWSIGPRTVWHGLKVRELQARIANQGHAATFSFFIDRSATMLLGKEGKLGDGKPGYALFLNQQENPSLPAALGTTP